MIRFKGARIQTLNSDFLAIMSGFKPKFDFYLLEIDHKTLIIAPGYCVYVVQVNKYV